MSCVDGVCNCCIYIEPQLFLANTHILRIVCVQSSGVTAAFIGDRDWGEGGDFIGASHRKCEIHSIG